MNSHQVQRRGLRFYSEEKEEGKKGAAEKNLEEPLLA